MRLNMGYVEGIRRLKSDLLEHWQGGKMFSECCFCVTCKGNSCGHYLMDVMLPPVDMLPVLRSLISKDSLWLCVFCFPEVVGLSISLNWLSREWNLFQRLHVDFPAAPEYIYTCEWQSGTNEAFCLLYIWDFLYIVFAARPVELIHWI